ncbi:hypothetical protein [Halalkalibacter nanhaiisediminis]|nr:hypothetical protein [Halalkalibacter nanhaiisediminis]
MLKLEVIVEVHQLKRQGFKVAAIARKCNLSRTTNASRFWRIKD